MPIHQQMGFASEFAAIGWAAAEFARQVLPRYSSLED